MVMDALGTGVFVLFGLLVPVSCEEVFFTVPVTCYILDGVLIIYCIVATALYFKEKFSQVPSAAVVVSEDRGGIYQELERPNEADPYQILEQTKRRSPLTQTDRDPSESLNPRGSAPPRPPH